MQELSNAPATSFYQRLDWALAASGFGDAVRKLREPYYGMDRSRGGSPAIDLEVYFKLQMLGSSKGTEGIGARCADSLSIRAFLH